MPGSQASASQEQAQELERAQAALAELEWAQVLESQAEPELDLLAEMDSQAGQVTQAVLAEAVQGSVQAARVAQALGSQGSQVPEWARAGPESQERESAQQGQQESQAQQAGQACQPQSSAHTHARSRHT